MSEQNILFFSRKCNHCNRFIQALNKTKARNKFLRICVDVRTTRLPQFVKRVPTIIVYDNNKKRFILDDKSAFEWLNSILDEPEEIQPFAQGEMSTSLSDSYAFVDGENDFDHNFAFLNNWQQTYINTPQSLESAQLGKVKDDELSQLQQQRERDVPLKRRPASQPSVPEGFFGARPGAGEATKQQQLAFEYERLQNLRNTDTRRRGPVPQRAPNFESSRFKTDPYFQSNRGGSRQPAGGISRGNVVNRSDYERLVNTRQTPQYQYTPTQGTPDFRVSRR